MLDTVLVPKVGSPSDVAFVATLLDQIEQRNGWEPGRIGIHILIETAAGMANVEAISRARPDRLEAMVFGVADYAASVRARTTNIGGANPDYAVLTDRSTTRAGAQTHWGDQWHFAISRMVAACRARGPAPDRRAVRRLQRRGRVSQRGPPRRRDGLRGQVGDPPVAGRARERGLHARRRARSTRAADPGGHGGRRRRRARARSSLDGRLIDAASIRMAENLMRQVEQMRGRSGVNIHEYQAKELLRVLRRADAPRGGRVHRRGRPPAWPRRWAAAGGS